MKPIKIGDTIRRAGKIGVVTAHIMRGGGPYKSTRHLWEVRVSIGAERPVIEKWPVEECEACGPNIAMADELMGVFGLKRTNDVNS